MRISKLIALISLFMITCIITLTALPQEKEHNSMSSIQFDDKPSNMFLPKNGCVPDKATAIKIAEAVWFPLYRESIYKQKPFKVELLNDSLWVVVGTLQPNMLGGVAYIEISKKDSKIFGIRHGK